MMSGKDLMLAAMNGEKTNRVPVTPPTNEV